MTEKGANPAIAHSSPSLKAAWITNSDGDAERPNVLQFLSFHSTTTKTISPDTAFFLQAVHKKVTPVKKNQWARKEIGPVQIDLEFIILSFSNDLWWNFHQNESCRSQKVTKVCSLHLFFWNHLDSQNCIWISQIWNLNFANDLEGRNLLTVVHIQVP